MTTSVVIDVVLVAVVVLLAVAWLVSRFVTRRAKRRAVSASDAVVGDALQRGLDRAQARAALEREILAKQRGR